MARRSVPRRSQRPALRWTGRTQPFQIPEPVLDAMAQGSARAAMPPAEAGSSGPGDLNSGRALAVSRCAEPKSAVRLCRRDGAVCAIASRPSRPNIATRQASQLVIDAIAEALPNLLGGSADLTHSNLTRAKTPAAGAARRLRRQLHSLWRPRARHGGGDERHRAAWRLHPLWRHVSHLCRLQPPRDQAGGADGHPRHPCDDA